MSNTAFRRKNPRWYWSLSFDSSPLNWHAVASFNPYSGANFNPTTGAQRGSAGNTGIGYLNSEDFAATPTARPWNYGWNQFFPALGVGPRWNGGIYWTAEYCYFLVDGYSTLSGGPDLDGLWRTDRWMTTQPVRIRTRAELLLRFPPVTHSRIAFTGLAVLPEHNWVIYVTNFQVNPTDYTLSFNRIPLQGGTALQSLEDHDDMTLRGICSDRDHGAAFAVVAVNDTNNNTQRHQIHRLDATDDSTTVIYEVESVPLSQSTNPKFLFCPSWDYVNNRLLVTEEEWIEEQVFSSLVIQKTSRIRSIKRTGAAVWTPSTGYEYQVPYTDHTTFDGPDVFIDRQHHSRSIIAWHSSLTGKVYEVRFIPNDGIPLDHPARTVGAGLYQYDAPSSGSILNPERLCDDPAEANFSSDNFNDLPRIALGPGCRANWEL